MTIKQQGGIFGRNPVFNSVESKELIIPRTTPNLEISSGVITPVGSYYKIDTEGAASTDDLDTITATKQGHVLVISPQSSTRDVVVKDGTGNLRLHSDFTMTHADDTLTLLCDGSNWVEISRNATLQNSYNIKFEDGYGIDFSATSGTGTSELFSDYEEGEWSPVVRDASSAGNTGGGTLKGYYTKIGRTVFLVFSSSNITTSGMTSGNDLFITGLPYTPATVDGTNYYTGALVMHSVTTSGNQVAAIQDAQDYIKLYEVVSGAAFEFIKVSDISSGVSDIRFSLTYEAA